MKNILFFNILMLSLCFVACKEKKSSEQSDMPSAESANETNGNITYRIIPEQSNIKWQGNGPTMAEHGNVPVSGGEIYVKDGQVTGGMIRMDMTRLTAESQQGDMKEKLESHLKGSAAGKEEDFFNVSKYPTATYEITSTSALNNDPEATHQVNGNLTIKNITKPVTFKARISIDGDKLTASAAPFDIDRTDFDIKYKSKKFFDNLKDDFINDTFQIGFYVVADKK